MGGNVHVRLHLNNQILHKTLHEVHHHYLQYKQLNEIRQQFCQQMHVQRYIWEKHH